DGTLRLVYLTGKQSTSSRYWVLMKSTNNGASWTLEATAQTYDDAFLVRDPATDTAHVVGWPGSAFPVYPYIYSSNNSYAPVALQGWPNHNYQWYKGMGIGPDGRLFVESYYDPYDGGTADSHTHYLFQTGTFNGTGWSFGSVYDYYMGYRKAYFHIIPGAF